MIRIALPLLAAAGFAVIATPAQARQQPAAEAQARVAYLTRNAWDCAGVQSNNGIRTSTLFELRADGAWRITGEHHVRVMIDGRVYKRRSRIGGRVVNDGGGFRVVLDQFHPVQTDALPGGMSFGPDASFVLRMSPASNGRDVYRVDGVERGTYGDVQFRCQVFRDNQPLMR
ncbi:MAG: hypothetical protein KF910_00460 [Brevundimonas sp.]|uniref:hypothetical protein n=1 Tax=Brevundimonas sp. TaxID=1871086 RepID=UPI0025BC1093|nr:hypothetical protein [Brevundimonas sp.]MBX3476059.1 hypothetical protein [Brevundimonas sp.]